MKVLNVETVDLLQSEEFLSCFTTSLCKILTKTNQVFLFQLFDVSNTITQVYFIPKFSLHEDKAHLEKEEQLFEPQLVILLHFFHSYEENNQ